MILQAKDLSPNQKLALESLLNRSLSDGDRISVHAVTPTPEWLKSIQEDAARQGLDKLTIEDIDAETDAPARNARSA